MISLNWLDLLILPGVAHGSFLAYTLMRIKRANREANYVMALLLIIAVFMLVGRIIWLRYPASWPIQISLIGDTPIFLFGPLCWWYTRRLLFSNQQLPVRIMLIHLAPAIIHLVKSLVYLLMGQEHFMRLYQSQFIAWDYLLTEGLAILLNVGYLGYTIKAIRKYARIKNEHLAFEQTPLQFLWVFIGAISLCIAGWIVGFLSQYLLGKSLFLANYNSVWIAISITIYLIGYYGFKQPDLFRLNYEALPKSKLARLNAQEVKMLNHQLEQLMVGQKVFLQSDLTLGKLSELLNTSANNLSWLLNETHQKSFYDYINGHRVYEFLRLVESGEHTHKTILALALEVGFNTKSTFNKSFKTTTGYTPSQFISSHGLDNQIQTSTL